MLPTTPSQLRFVRAARRARLARLAAGGALVLLPVACGHDDAGVFEAAGDGASEAAVVDTTAPSDDATFSQTDATLPETDAAVEDPPASTAADTTVAETSAETTVAESTAAETTATDGVTIPASSEMVVEFTSAASSSGGRVNNPYIAVWVEDTDGNLVQTISVWYLQSQKGLRWLGDLSNWYSVSGGAAMTSGATRAAGSYSVVWDGTDLDGELVAAGEYVLFVESAREHGPHSLTSSTVTVGSDGFSVSLPDDGELTALTATMTV